MRTGNWSVWIASRAHSALTTVGDRPYLERNVAVRLSIGVGLALALLLGGCFAELGLQGTGEPEPMCELGSVACACYGNDSCDPGLRCVPEISTCVPADCIEGTEQCTCTPDGACVDGFSCAGGVCVDPWPQSDTASTSGSDSGDPPDAEASGNPSTTESTTSITTTDSGPTTTTATTTSTTTEETGEETTTTEGVPMCDDGLSCGVCVDCVTEAGQECAAEANECDGEFGCLEASLCLRACGVKGLCQDNCCAGTSNAASMKAEALNACRANACAVQCAGGYSDGLCA